MTPLAEMFRALTADVVLAMITNQREEDLHLDFKRVGSPDMSKDDRRNLSKALSGFANSDGGIIIWGVDARPNADGIDCAQARADVPKLKLLLTRLNEFTGQAVVPLVDNVEHRILPVADDGGFAATIVPGSDLGPHMALAGENHYYKRSGAAFYRLEHFDIADMFGRRSQPILKVGYQFLGDGIASGGANTLHMGKLVIYIENVGRGLARALYLAIEPGPKSVYDVDHYGIDGNCHEGLPRSASARAGAVVYGSGVDHFIHPRSRIDVCAIAFQVAIDGNRQVRAPQPMTVSYEVAAEGSPLRSGELLIGSDELVRALIPAHLRA